MWLPQGHPGSTAEPVKGPAAQVSTLTIKACFPSQVSAGQWSEMRVPVDLLIFCTLGLQIYNKILIGTWIKGTRWKALETEFSPYLLHELTMAIQLSTIHPTCYLLKPLKIQSSWSSWVLVSLLRRAAKTPVWTSFCGHLWHGHLTSSFYQGV